MSRRAVRLVTLLILLSWSVSLLATRIWVSHEVEHAVESEPHLDWSEDRQVYEEGEEGIPDDTVHALAALAFVLLAVPAPVPHVSTASLHVPSEPLPPRFRAADSPFEPPRS